MADEMLDQLLLLWLEKHQEMMAATENERAKLEKAKADIAEIELPYKVAMEALVDEIVPFIMQMGSTYSDIPGVVAGYRSSFVRTTYNKDMVNVVLGFLDDIAPNAAEQLRDARKMTSVPAKVTVKAEGG